MVEKADLIPKDLVITPNDKKAKEAKLAVQKPPEKQPFYRPEEKAERNPGPGFVFYFAVILLVTITVSVFVFVQYQYTKNQKALFEASQL